ncbi:DUF1266 domain-containing protein [Streptomyces chryseus]
MNMNQPHPSHIPHGYGYPASWAAPSETERLLHEAGMRGDLAGQLRVLAGAELYIGAPKAEVDAAPERITWRSHWNPAGWSCKPVLTRGMLPPWHPEWVFHGVSLQWISKFDWDPSELLAVNGGTPAQVLLAANPQDRKAWRQYCVPSDQPDGARLIGLRHGALQGPLAYGLACGVHLAIVNDVPWNEVGTVYHEYSNEISFLREIWGITERSQWQAQLHYLLDARNSPPEPDFTLRVREGLRAGLGELPTADLWRETAAGHAQDLGAGQAKVKDIEDLVRRIVRYEARFRADGLLPPDGRVTTTVAYDYGRAVNLARWGLSARFCHPHEAEQAIVHAGALSKSAYHSWQDFSAAYALGRVLRFDDEKYGKWYEQNLVAHRLLTENEGSPWRNIPWR